VLSIPSICLVVKPNFLSSPAIHQHLRSLGSNRQLRKISQESRVAHTSVQLTHQKRTGISCSERKQADLACRLTSAVSSPQVAARLGAKLSSDVAEVLDDDHGTRSLLSAFLTDRAQPETSEATAAAGSRRCRPADRQRRRLARKCRQRPQAPGRVPLALAVLLRSFLADSLVGVRKR
jgi:hypothetical protein